MDSSHIYWANSVDHTIKMAPLTGGDSYVTTLISGLGLPNDLAIDGDTIYWADAQSGTINKAPLSGSPVTTLANSTLPYGVAVNNTHVYWTTLQAPPAPSTRFR